MKRYTVCFKQENIRIQVEAGTTLLEAEIAAGLCPDAPCGGQGTCGKCKVRIIEHKGISAKRACTTKVYHDMLIDTALKAKEHNLLVKGMSKIIPISPMMQKIPIVVTKSNTEDASSQWDCLKEAVSQAAHISVNEIKPNLEIASRLQTSIDNGTFNGYAFLCDNEIIDLQEEDRVYYLAAFDIGTTSVVGYLLDSQTGEELAVDSMLNPQVQYGADVIMRSNYALQHGGEAPSLIIRQAINQLLVQLAIKASISPKDIYQISIVGNTCMHHLFLGIPTSSLVQAPYKPCISEPLLLAASDYQLHIHPGGKLMMLPGIAGFVGADTIGCLLATDFDNRKDTVLMIDIGTNGEMVLRAGQQMIACSTAAGPAFEGAKIDCGMRGAEGAISQVYIKEKQLQYTVIGAHEPLGICGSGIMDLTALLLTYGFMDDTGRLLSVGELQNEVAIANWIRLIRIEDQPAFALTDSIYFCQKDIREVQLAKAAIAAGIKLMCSHLDIEAGDITEVLIAGAFGNYMSPDSACIIGLLPPILRKRIIPIGNAAGEGAKIAVLNESEFYRSKYLAKKITFLELALEPKFQDTFIDELSF